MTRAELLELLKKARKQLKKYHVPKDEQTVTLSIDTLENALLEQPQVVRCKDCVFGKREKNDSTGMTWIYCGHHRENRPEDWFCASGSRI